MLNIFNNSTGGNIINLVHSLAGSQQSPVVAQAVKYATNDAAKTTLTRSDSVPNDMNTLYRYDQRSPRNIMSKGFEGTLTHNASHAFAAFEEDTVFTSKTLKGVENYRSIQEASFSKGEARYALKQNGQFFLYKINQQNNPYLDFAAEYAIQGDEFIMKIAQQKEFDLVGSTSNWQIVYRNLRPQIIRTFVGFKEVHLQAPVIPKQITPIYPSNLDYLDLAMW